MDSSLFTGRGYATSRSSNHRSPTTLGLGGGEALLLAILAFDIPAIEDLLYIPPPLPPNPTPPSPCSPKYASLVCRRERAREVLRILTSPIELSQNVSALARKSNAPHGGSSNNGAGPPAGDSRRLLSACVAVDPRRSIGTVHARLLAAMDDGPTNDKIGNSLKNDVNDEHVALCCKDNKDGSDNENEDDDGGDEEGAAYHCTVSPALLQPLATFEGDWPIIAALFAIHVPCAIPQCCQSKISIAAKSIGGGERGGRSSSRTRTITHGVGDWHTVEIGLLCDGCRFTSSSSSSSTPSSEEGEDDCWNHDGPLSEDPDEDDEDEDDDPSVRFRSSATPLEMCCEEEETEEEEDEEEGDDKAFGSVKPKRENSEEEEDEYSIMSSRKLSPSVADGNNDRIRTARPSKDIADFPQYHALESFPFVVAAEEAIVSASFAPERTRSPMDACIYWCRAAVLRILLRKAEEAAAILRIEAEEDERDHHDVSSLRLFFPSPCELSAYRLRGGSRKDDDTSEKEFFIQPAFAPFRRHKVAPNMGRRHRDQQARYDVAAYESAQRRVLTAIVRSGVYELVPRAVESGFMFSPPPPPPPPLPPREEEKEQPHGSKKGRNNNNICGSYSTHASNSYNNKKKSSEQAGAVEKSRSRQSALDHFERLGYPNKAHTCKGVGATNRKRSTAAAAAATINYSHDARAKCISISDSDITAAATCGSLPSALEMYKRIDPSERIVRVRDSSSSSRQTLLHLASRWEPEKHFPPKVEDLERVFGHSHPFVIRSEVSALNGIQHLQDLPESSSRTNDDLNDSSFSQPWDQRLREKWCSAAIIEIVAREAAALLDVQMPPVAPSVLDTWTDGPRASFTAAAAADSCCCRSSPPHFALPTNICSRMISSLLHAGIDYELVERQHFYLSQPAIFIPIAVLGEGREDSSDIESTARGEAVVAMLSAFFDFARAKDEAVASVGVATSPSRSVNNKQMSPSRTNNYHGINMNNLTTASASYDPSPATTSVTHRMQSTLDAHGYSLLLCTLYKLVHDDAVVAHGGPLGTGESLAWCLDIEDNVDIQRIISASASASTFIFLDNEAEKGGKKGEKEAVATNNAEVDTYTLRKYKSLRNRETRVVRVLRYLLSPPLIISLRSSSATTSACLADAASNESSSQGGGGGSRIINGAGLSVSLASAPNKGFFPFASLFSMKAAELLLEFGGDPLYLIGERTPLSRVHPRILEMCIDRGLEVCGRGGAARASAAKHGLTCSYRLKCLQRYNPLLGIGGGTHGEEGEREVEGTPPQLSRGSERALFGGVRAGGFSSSHSHFSNGGASMRRSLLFNKGGAGTPPPSLRPPLRCFECFRDSTPLHLAVSALQVRLVRLLLANGAGMVGPSSCCDPSPYASDLWVEDYSGKLPIDCVPRASEVSPHAPIHPHAHALAQRVVKLLREAMGIDGDTA